MNHKRLGRNFVRQQGQSDCGVACLASIVRFHGGAVSLDYLRQISGTTKHGTNLLGLKEAAQLIGFNAKGLTALNIDDLRHLNAPAILHIIIERRLQHFVVFYGFDGDRVIIGNPQFGVELWSLGRLSEAWHSKALLSLEPTNSFQKRKPTESNWRWLIALVKEDENILSASLFLGCIVAVFSIATAVFTQQLVDFILPNKSITNLTIGLTLLCLILLVKSGLSYVRSLFLTKQGRELNKRIIKQFYDSLLLLPQPFFDSKKTGELVSRMNDTTRIQAVIANLVGTVIVEIFMTVISLLAIFIYSPEMGFVAVSVIPLSLVLLFYFSNSVAANQRDVMALQAINESNYIDTITGISEIKAANKQELFSQKTADIYRSFQDKLLDFGKLKIRFGFFLELVTILALMISLSYSTLLVFRNEMKIGELIAILSLIASIIPSLTRSTVFYFQIQEARIAVDRMKEFTNLEPEHGEDIYMDKSGVINLDVKRLHFKYPGSLSLLNDINLTINGSRITVLLGESGCGKSTLLQIIHRHYRQQEGDILFGSRNINNVNPSQIRKHVGFIQQDIKIFNGNLMFNIALSDDKSDAESALAWCRTNGFDRYFSIFPQGYATLLGEDGINISGGQKQLVAFARVLHRKPSILLIDEGTSAMDRNTENFILSVLNKAKLEMGILLVTHRIRTASKADFIYVLENGRLTVAGSPESLLKTDNFFSKGYREIVETTLT